MLRTPAPKRLAECLTLCSAPLANTARTFCTKVDLVCQFTEYALDQRKLVEKRRVKDKEKEERMQQLKKTNLMYMFGFYEAPDQYSFSVLHMGSWWKERDLLFRRYQQRFQSERHEALGYDLAAAHFLVMRGGRVKFKDRPEWVTMIDIMELPRSYDPNYIVTAIDIQDMRLVDVGVENLMGLVYLEWLSLKGCDGIDDWVLDTISAEYPLLKYLDISDCKNVTERGLESLYRMYSLEKLIVTNHYKSAAFELTCLMLEDVLPDLTCEILVPNEEEKNV